MPTATKTINTKPKKLTLIISCPRSFIWHRVEFCRELIKNYDLDIIMPFSPESQKYETEFKIHYIDVNRKGTNPLIELKLFLKLLFLLKKISPNIIHVFNIKPVIYGTLAARLLKIPKIVNTITGLGYIFTDKSAKRNILKLIITIFYKLILNSNKVRIIFQNPDDMAYFRNHKLIKKNQTYLIKGSGVDLKRFTPNFELKNPETIILFSARILKDKGIYELIESSRVAYNSVKFKLWIAGPIDSGNPSGLSLDELNSLIDSSFMTYLGEVKDMPSLLQKIDIVCLPSYREGVPMSLLEALASGKPIITTDVPGCREVINLLKPNGFLVPLQNIDELTKAIIQLVGNSELSKKMSLNAREFATEFSQESIFKQIISTYHY
jgi:glycosyltransferase involved in cell wall biosynthesis